MALPLACLGSVIGLYFTDQTLNAMTLGGLAVVIGLLIDESIVVLENTARHLALGKSPLEAALDGAGEVTRPLTMVTVTISVVFFPVVFISGIGKFLFMPLALSVIFAVVTSLNGELRPGMYASVKLDLERRRNVLLIPAEALVIEKGKAFVFTIVSGKAKKVGVETGFNDGIQVEIAGGLAPDQAVIVAGWQALKDGQSVRVREGK